VVSSYLGYLKKTLCCFGTFSRSQTACEQESCQRRSTQQNVLLKSEPRDDSDDTRHRVISFKINRRKQPARSHDALQTCRTAVDRLAVQSGCGPFGAADAKVQRDAAYL